MLLAHRSPFFSPPVSSKYKMEELYYSVLMDITDEKKNKKQTKTTTSRDELALRKQRRRGRKRERGQGRGHSTEAGEGTTGHQPTAAESHQPPT